MKEKPVILVVEKDLPVRQPLTEYLRECGYKVIEAINIDEAIEVLTNGVPVEIVLADVTSAGKVDGFGLAHWMRSNGTKAKVILAATVEKAVATAEQLCANGPLLKKPYDHTILHDRIKRELAARAQTQLVPPPFKVPN